MTDNPNKAPDIEAPEYADNTPKKNKPYRKRVVVTMMVIAGILLYVIFSSTEKNEQERKAVEKPNYTSALSLSNAFIETQERESTMLLAPVSSEGVSEDVLELPAQPEKESKGGTPPALDLFPVASDGGTPSVEADPALQEEMALRKQWLEQQKSAFLSKPDVQGQWAATAEKNAAEEKEAEKPQRNDYLDTLNALLIKSNSDKANAAQSSQNAKEKFFSTPSTTGYLAATRQEMISPYLIPSGSMIPCTLISGINSDLPGNITAMVTENVFDWSRPNVCLIPQGTRIFGIYDSNIDFAQKRIQVKWSRLIYPDGSTLDIGGMAGVNRQGYSGLKDKFYGHYGRMITAAILTTAFGIIPELIADNNNSSGTSVSSGGQVIYVPQNDDNTQRAGEAVGRALGEVGNKFFDKALNVKPTVLIRPGTRFHVLVNKDMPFFKAWGSR
ncbi:MAG: hypothetical protein LUC51_11635 [Cloacibacillus porcorum]|nr:hypothetical protein [Cloacibacillus porcorum]